MEEPLKSHIKIYARKFSELIDWQELNDYKKWKVKAEKLFLKEGCTKMQKIEIRIKKDGQIFIQLNCKFLTEEIVNILLKN